jgi:hypothetical protein
MLRYPLTRATCLKMVLPIRQRWIPCSLLFSSD